MNGLETWFRRIEDTAHDRVAWNSKADASPWDGFYRDYRDASPAERAVIDEAFVACRDSEDPDVVAVLILHSSQLPAARAVTLLLDMLKQRTAFLQAHRGTVSERSLMALALHQLAERGGSSPLEVVSTVREGTQSG